MIDGLWVLLVSNEGELTAQDADGRVPVMARAGNDQTYLLVFKNVVKARRSARLQELDGAEPRMVVRGNRDDIVRIAQFRRRRRHPPGLRRQVRRSTPPPTRSRNSHPRLLASSRR